ncbi:hypothetical protein AUF12_03895 [Enterococcus avium]|uniref:FRG domain-containing protein n=1 Tax=Enterococcus avium TaxID=33945 RepID=UPI000C9C10EE|nr:FRG domain-containing protein [Enterococcus avium]MDT2565845.1 FRG domain-containing protein [Enterococcus avium]PNE49689.1 hypothetical protein AUF12_03895 [Enterococcus avium]
MKPEVKTVKSIKEFIDFLEKSENEYVFRGERKDYGNTTCQASIFRKKDEQKINEKNLMDTIINQRPTDFTGVQGNIDNLLKMQHYGIPTRLIDISFNPLVALFFACMDAKGSDVSDGYVFFIESNNYRKKSPNSDTLAIISSISRMSNEEKAELINAVKIYHVFKTISTIVIIKYHKLEDILSREKLYKFEDFIEKLKYDDFSINSNDEIDLDDFEINHLNDSEVLITFKLVNQIHKSKDKKVLYKTFAYDNSIFSQTLVKNRDEEMFKKIEDYSLFDKQVKEVFDEFFAGDYQDKVEKAWTDLTILNHLIDCNFNETRIIKKLLHEVRNFRPGFVNELKMEDLEQDYIVLPRYTNNRIINQKGGFIIKGLTTGELLDENDFLKITIPSSSKEHILKSLKMLGIDNDFIYPELDKYDTSIFFE